MLYQLMKYIIEAIEASPKALPTTPRFNLDILLVSRKSLLMKWQYKSASFNGFNYNLEQLLDVSKGQEFMKVFAELLKTNLNLRKYFKNLLQPDCSFNKSMQLIVRYFFSLSLLRFFILMFAYLEFLCV